jgi:hypothetical protein
MQISRPRLRHTRSSSIVASIEDSHAGDLFTPYTLMSTRYIPGVLETMVIIVQALQNRAFSICLETLGSAFDMHHSHPPQQDTWPTTAIIMHFLLATHQDLLRIGVTINIVTFPRA